MGDLHRKEKKKVWLNFYVTGHCFQYRCFLWQKIKNKDTKRMAIICVNPLIASQSTHIIDILASVPQDTQTILGDA